MPITAVWQNWDAGYPVQELGLVTRINFVRWSSFFSILAALDHYWIVVSWKKYEKDLKVNVNRFRWYEYSLSSGLIICLLMMIWGYFDFVQISGVFLINTCTILFGDMHEQLNKGKYKKEEITWTAFYYGAMCGAVTWIVLWYNILTDPYISEYPTIAWIYLFFYMSCFFSFPYNLYSQFSQNGSYNNELYQPELKNGGYLYGERVYIYLSFVSKSVLLYMVCFAYIDESFDYWKTLGSNY